MTRDLIAPMSSVSTDVFRDIMSRFAASVSVITTSADGQIHGMTATSVCSVSDDPPSLLVVINRRGRSHDLMCRSGVFAVNLLSVRQSGLASSFASACTKSSDIADFRWGASGAPVLSDAQACAECEVISRVDAGTHSIFVGRIVEARSSEAAPLIYHRRRFWELDSTASWRG